MGSSCTKSKNKSNDKNETNFKVAETTKNLEKPNEPINVKTNNNNNINKNNNDIRNFGSNSSKVSEITSKNLEKPNEPINVKTNNNNINKNNNDIRNLGSSKNKVSEITRTKEDEKPEEKQIVMPYNYEAILKNADSQIDKSTPEKIYEQLYKGVYLNQKKKKYWVDKKTNKNCFMLFAKDLTIAWGDDERFWIWSQLKETSKSEVMIDVAELIMVYWLDINGKFNTKNLSPNTIYEVVYVMMVTSDTFGWFVPVNIRLILPDGKKQEKTEVLDGKAIDEWIEVKVGEFTSAPEKGGNIEFFFYETATMGPKRGLLVKGVIIRPKST